MWILYDALKTKGGKANEEIYEIKKVRHDYVSLDNKIEEIDDDFNMDEVKRVISELKEKI